MHFKTSRTGRRLLHGLLTLTTVASLAAQEIPVTVQGRLTHEGRAVNGPHDFYFLLTGGPDGAKLAEVIEPHVAVRDGLFTVPVNFRWEPFFDVFYTGPDGFSSAERWLEISVRPSPGGETTAAAHGAGRVGLAAPPPGFVTLGPAIQITAAPTAIHAALAASLAPGAVLSASALALPLTGSGLVSLSGGKFAVSPPAWLLSGNAGTGPTNFLGTTDAQPLEVRVFNQRALLIEPRAVGPNLIGGHEANAILGSAGAVIAGGGAAANPNVISNANHAFIGGGLSNYVSGGAAVVAGGASNAATNGYAVVSGGVQNLARATATTVAGGASNQAEGAYAVVGGGSANLANGIAATVGGGDSNRALVDAATVGGGQGNEAFGPGTTVSGGAGNRAHLDYATVSGGTENWAQSFGATVGGGGGNWAHGPNSTVAGGAANQALGAYSIIPGGTQALATQHGQMAQSAGNFGDLGDAQTSVYVLRGQTGPGASGTVLSLDGLGAPLRLGGDQTVTFDLLVVGRSQGLPPNFQISGGYAARGVIKRVGGGPATFVGTPSVVELGEDDPAWQVRLQAVGDSLQIEVHSAATPDSVRWVARVHTAETMWGSFFPPTP